MPCSTYHCTNYLFYVAILFLINACESNHPKDWKTTFLANGNPEIKAINHKSIALGEGSFSILHCRIITGDGHTVLEDGFVTIKGSRISKMGKFSEANIQEGVKTLDASGMTLLPGLIDAHFHLDQLDSLPTTFLSRGITSLRDPGAWIEAYDNELNSGRPLPRLYLTGPHFDMHPAAYPKNAILLKGPLEAEKAVHQFADQGASAIKIYFKSSLEIIQATCQIAHQRDIPVTAHLEITNIYDAVEAGIDGIEHITSFGSNLIPRREAEAYKQAILKDNNARRLGRYSMWESIDPTDEEAMALAYFLKNKQIFVCPTLGAFEYQPTEETTDTLRLLAFQHMLQYTKTLYDAGVKVVVGSHSWVRYSDYGWAYHHEMELLQKLGLMPLEIIRAATMDNAQFFGIGKRIGTIEAGKVADLILVSGNPLEDIAKLREVRKVMLAGNWIF